MTPDLVDFDVLRDSFPRLYRTLVKATNHVSGIHPVGIDFLSEYTRGELSDWLAAEREVPPPAPPKVPEQPVEPAEPQISMAEIEEENQRDMKARADEAAAKTRLDQYVAEQGLEPSQQNLNVISAWLRQNLKSYFSAAGVDACIANLGPRGTNVLRWIPKMVEPPAPELTEPAEILEPWQLRIDATEAEMRRADLRALKDLLARRRAITGKYIRTSNSFGSRF